MTGSLVAYISCYKIVAPLWERLWWWCGFLYEGLREHCFAVLSITGVNLRVEVYVHLDECLQYEGFIELRESHRYRRIDGSSRIDVWIPPWTNSCMVMFVHRHAWSRDDDTAVDIFLRDTDWDYLRVSHVYIRCPWLRHRKLGVPWRVWTYGQKVNYLE